ncbi:MAG TPA: flagellar hook capping FlgD N-terminal domain-containing protein [Micrococcaceae bacterium]|nr:flagellar hook capping FlgD N-terminal domain-containing protein [Micrococcaceae bacterium]
MSIDPVGAPVTTAPAAAGGSSLYATAPTAAPKQVMDSSMFMSLLVTQLQNQDPSSPMDTNQMIGQTTQLAMMEKITDMTTTSQENFSLQMRIAAAALVGKQVTYTGSDGNTVTGQATAVSYAGSVPQVTIDGKTIALDAVSGVAAAAPAASATPAPSTTDPTAASTSTASA